MNEQTKMEPKDTPGAYIVEIEVANANDNKDFTYIMFTYANSETEVREISLERAKEKFNGEIFILDVHKLSWGNFYGVMIDYT